MGGLHVPREGRASPRHLAALLRSAGACLVLALFSAAHAHEFWMLPGSFHADPGDSITLSLAVGEHFSGEPVAFSPPLVARLRRLSAGGSEELHARTAAGASSPAIAVRLPRAGTHLIMIDTHPSEIELPADTFDAYLRQEGLHAVRAARTAAGTAAMPARERYRRNVKTLVQVGGISDPTYARRTGQRLEIVPGADPFRLAAQASLQLQVLFDARPLPRALVKLWQGSGSTALVDEGITDAKGRVQLAVTRPGVWMASVVHMVPAPAGSGFDWDSYWGNLTFAVGPAAGQAAAGSGAPRR